MIDVRIRAAGVRFIVHDPIGALIRTLMKGWWYFLGVPEVPVPTESVLPELRTDRSLTLGRRTDVLSLVYLPGGITFLIPFWFSPTHFSLTGDPVRACYLSFIVMGVVMVIFFSDTRLREGAEFLTDVPISLCLARRIRLPSNGSDRAADGSSRPFTASTPGSFMRVSRKCRESRIYDGLFVL